MQVSDFLRKHPAKLVDQTFPVLPDINRGLAVLVQVNRLVPVDDFNQVFAHLIIDIPCEMVDVVRKGRLPLQVAVHVDESHPRLILCPFTQEMVELRIIEMPALIGPLCVGLVGNFASEHENQHRIRGQMLVDETDILNDFLRLYPVGVFKIQLKGLKRVSGKRAIRCKQRAVDEVRP